MFQHIVSRTSVSTKPSARWCPAIRSGLENGCSTAFSMIVAINLSDIHDSHTMPAILKPEFSAILSAAPAFMHGATVLSRSSDPARQSIGPLGRHSDAHPIAQRGRPPVGLRPRHGRPLACCVRRQADQRSCLCSAHRIVAPVVLLPAGVPLDGSRSSRVAAQYVGSVTRVYRGRRSGRAFAYVWPMGVNANASVCAQICVTRAVCSVAPSCTTMSHSRRFSMCIDHRGPPPNSSLNRTPAGGLSPARRSPVS